MNDEPASEFTPGAPRGFSMYTILVSILHGIMIF